MLGSASRVWGRLLAVACSLSLLLGVFIDTSRAADIEKVPVASLPCTGSVDDNTLAGVRRVQQVTVVLDSVALPTRKALGTSQGADPTSLYFTKQPLFVRARRSIRLRVTAAWRDKASMNFGNSERTNELVVTACEPRSRHSPFKWLTFIGGFYVTAPACVPIAVTAGHRTRVVHVGIGAACSGQAPPPEP